MSNNTWRRQLVSSHVLTGSDDATSTLSSSSSSVASQSQSQSQSAPVSFNSARFSHLVACTPIGDDGSLILAESNGTIRMCVMGKNDKNEGVETLLIPKSLQEKNGSQVSAAATAATAAAAAGDVTMSDDAASSPDTNSTSSLQSRIDSVGLIPFVCDSPIISITGPTGYERVYYSHKDAKKRESTQVHTLLLHHSHSITRVEWIRQIENDWRNKKHALAQVIRVLPTRTWLNSSTKIVSCARPISTVNVTTWRKDVKEFTDSLVITQEGSGDVWLQSYENAKRELTSQVLIKEEQFVALLPSGTSSASTVASSSSSSTSTTPSTSFSIAPILHISNRFYILSHGHIFLATLSSPRTLAEQAAKKAESEKDSAEARKAARKRAIEDREAGREPEVPVDPQTLPILALEKLELFVGLSPHTSTPYFRMKSSDYILRSVKLTHAIRVCDRIEGTVTEFSMTGELRQNIEPACPNYKLALPIVDFGVAAQDETMYVIDSKGSRVVEWTSDDTEKAKYDLNGIRRKAEPKEILKVQLPPPLEFPPPTTETTTS